MSVPIISIMSSLTDHSDIVEIAESIARQTYQGPFETIFVDSSGIPETARLMSQIPPAIARRINLQCVYGSPAGRGQSLNRAVRLSAGDVYLFLGDDFVPASNWLEEHARLHREQPGDEVVGLGPAVFPERLARNPFMRWLEQTDRAFGARFTGDDGGAVPPTWFYGANTSIKRSLFWRGGLFDEEFPYDALEDYELSFRLFRLGMRVVYLPAASAIHEHHIELEERVRQLFNCGESLALLDAKFANRPLGSIRRPRKAWKHALRAWGWKLASRFSSSPRILEKYWQHTVDASFHRGYESAWRKHLADPRPIRRLSVSLPAQIEETLAAGVIRWQYGERVSGQTLYPFENDDSCLRPTEHDATDCFAVSNPKGSAWAYFRVDPIFAQYATSEIRLTCELQAPARSKVWIEYDSDDEQVQVVPGKPGAFKKTTLQRASGRWQHLEFKIPDLHPQERINMGDFRVVCQLDPGVEFHLRSIEMTREAANANSHPGPYALLQKIGFPPTKNPRVSIVIPVHNHLLYTLQCLQSLAAIPNAHPMEVIVVDDASTDGTRDVLRSIPGLRLIELPHNLGFTGACRNGAAAAIGEYLLFLNNDIVAQPGWLDEMVKVIDDHSNAGIVGSRLIYPQTGKEQHVGVAYDAQGRPFHLDRDGGTALGPIGETWAAPAVTGACLLTPRKLYEQLDGFDPYYDQECQDIDYCCKVFEAGYSIHYCGSSVLLHYESVTRREIRWAPERDLKKFLARWELAPDGVNMIRKPARSKAA